TGEIAGVGLAWLTFYGSALAAGRGAHIASPSILAVMPPSLRMMTAIISEVLVILFFLMLFWTGMRVIDVLQGSNLVSVPFISQQLSVSALPIGALLFVIAELLRLPELLKEVREGRVSQVDDEIDQIDQAKTSAETA
ncbi:MAG: TRAP transporter small permease subunit, partial [Alcaligenaceae bacterium]|nr:TRAP transporter small permease subunit [Alcaligenaceae bacterium]